MKEKIETKIIKFKIVRKTSEYNKYIKWFLECYRENGSLLSSSGYKTEKEARSKVVNSAILMPIGDRLIQTVYQEAI